MRFIGIYSLAVALYPATCQGEKVHGEALINLPWDDLKNILSADAELKNTSPIDYLIQCAPEFLEKDLSERSNHYLINKSSGVCVSHLYAGFESSNPLASEKDLTMLERWNTYIPPGEDKGDDPSSTFSMELVKEWLDPSENVSYNIPPKVLFPAVAKDAVAAVAFAKEHNVELSVKNSGHSFTGSSMKKDTLHLNMNKFKQYSSTGIEECELSTEGSTEISNMIQDDLSNQACVLALARGKNAAIRVGGGENFDKVYRSVKAFNEKQPGGYKYLIVGGGAGTVSPMGWTFQGGMSSQTHGRKFGFGADQVLQIEMVLPKGKHVRFGPTAWEDASGDGFRYPKTTEVSGVCNDRPTEEDESLWEWKACSDDIDFGDLWFAMRGGGGGTWGIVLSVQLQLHEYLPVRMTYTPVGIMDFFDDAPAALVRAAWDFLFYFLWEPEKIGLSEEDSNSCGSASAVYLFCYGDAGINMLMAWKTYLVSKNATLIEAGVSSETIAASDIGNAGSSAVGKDLAEFALITEGPHTGKVGDDPHPYFASDQESNKNWLIPQKCILDNRDYFIDTFSGDGGFYFAFGVNPGIAHDQASSVSTAHREAGVMFFNGAGIFTGTLSELCYDITDKDNFPPMYGCNHSGPNHAGPLKSDWTKPCPEDWTQEKRESECIPQQEVIYGTKTLARLETIKKAVDPTMMFNCNKCIGNKPKAMEDSQDDSSQDKPRGGDDSSTSGSSSLLESSGMMQLVVSCVLALVILSL